MSLQFPHFLTFMVGGITILVFKVLDYFNLVFKFWLFGEMSDLRVRVKMLRNKERRMINK